jgi:ferredoxin
LRDIIEIDENLCHGGGDCISACHGGALQIIDNKARLISDLMCDGLGACLGNCPTGAMQVIQREAPPL